MIIVKPGKDPKDVLYEYECSHCGCVFRFRIDEITFCGCFVDIECPCCKKIAALSKTSLECRVVKEEEKKANYTLRDLIDYAVKNTDISGWIRFKKDDVDECINYYRGEIIHPSNYREILKLYLNTTVTSCCITSGHDCVNYCLKLS